MSESKRRLGWVFLAWMAKLGFALIAVAIPLLGVWIGSSLAKALDGPLWLPIAAGALCFPAVPLLWEAWARWRRRAGTRAPILTLFDRLLLRTLAVNLLFTGSLLALYPSTVFTALSEHGDWMLQGREFPRARASLHAAADHMQWLHELTHPNAYEEMIDADKMGAEVEVDEGVPSPRDVGRRDGWPFEPELHPLVRAIPDAQQVTPEAIGRYFAEHEADPHRRLKAVHDYVADRIAYDVPAFRTMTFPPQDAQSVLDAKLGVCAGYAQLVHAIGESAGLEVVVVVGKTRQYGSLGHAWNAAKVEGEWYLLDATWDAGSVDERFTKRYGADYLMTPPDVFLYDHFPDDPKWQLREEPISMGDFLRRPQLEPSFFAYDFELLSPTRANVTVDGRTLDVGLKNPNGLSVSAQSYIGDSWDGPATRCRVDGGTEVSCPLQASGPNLVVLFGPDGRNMAQLHVDAR